ncbi:hypothetical protein NUW54_g10867 [Trametes sanguinea]|uniref:Uncharacterized protein n=1 Tax=Trametes sanguinea TaxID=158606 RepID=A0ACC1NQE2_9APHY|nr:hypothetical protein NUW54_g10867 [Trametes sanguinea]
MRHLAAYLLLQIGGNASPSAADIKKVLGATRALSRSYEALLKDKAIIAAEVLHEYDEKFVYPRVNPVRKDAAVMTHESEMVSVWD